jgi:predicted permease
MDGSGWRDASSVRLARAILRGARGVVPFRRRTSWHREWEAELWVLQSRGAGPLRLVRFALGGLAHAFWERREEEGMMMDGLAQDIRAALRRLGRSPGFTFVTTAVLALGIGANTALFGALHAALLATPPYPDVDRIVTVDLLLESRAGAPADTMGWSYPKFELGRAELGSLETLAGYAPSTLTLTGTGPATRMAVEYVTPAYFTLLGVRPAAGRLLVPAEEAPAEAPVALLSHDLWADRFARDPGVIGRSIVLNGASLTVVGVLEEGFAGLTGSADLWIPVAGISAISGPRRLQLPWAHWLRGIARLAPDVSLGQAREEAGAVGRALTEAYPDPDGGGAHDVALVPFVDARVNPVARTSVTAVSAAALLFLLIACGSVASLLLARAAHRRSDIAVRATLGAGRGRLLREQIVESLILAGAGGGVGLGIALGSQRLVAVAARYALDTSGTRGLRYLDPDAFAIGAGTLALGMGGALLTGLVFGLLPAWVSSRATPGAGLRSTRAVGRRDDAGRSVLVSAQLAMTLVLLAGAGLMGSSFARLANVRTGFEHDDVLTLSYERGADASDDEQHGFMADVLARLEVLPSVERASAATCPPLAGRCEIAGLRQVDDQPPRDYSEMSGVLAYAVSDAYFETIGTPLVEGRTFDRADADGPPVVLVNETAASEMFAGGSAIGHRLSITHALTESEMATVVGVVGDVRYAALEEDPMPAVYLSERQVAMPYGTLLVRTVGTTGDVLESVRRAVAELDPDLPLFGVSTLGERRAAATARTRIILALLAAFGLSGLLIGALGLYGIVSQSVSRRTAEVGLRIALGADRAGVLRLMVAKPTLIALVAAVIGTVGAVVLTGYLDALIYGVTSSEPAVLAGAALALLAVAAVAAWIPARRATRISPTDALRAE